MNPSDEKTIVLTVCPKVLLARQRITCLELKGRKARGGLGSGSSRRRRLRIISRTYDHETRVRQDLYFVS